MASCMADNLTLWMIDFAHIRCKNVSGQVMWPDSITLWVTFETSINLQVANIVSK